MKLYYSIREVASQVGETESTLRFWQSEFPEEIRPTRRREHGIRYYQEKDIEDIQRIQYFIRDCRLTLDGVRKRLDNNREMAVRQAEIVLRLKNIKTELKALGKAMDEIASG